MYFWPRLGIINKSRTLRLRLFSAYSYFCHYYSWILLLSSRIIQFQPQGIPRIFLIFCKISAWYSYELKKKFVIDNLFGLYILFHSLPALMPTSTFLFRIKSLKNDNLDCPNKLLTNLLNIYKKETFASIFIINWS